MSRHPPPEKHWLAYYRGLIGAWAKRSASPRDAEDAAQDVAVNLLRNGEAAVLDSKPYLYGATQNRLSGEFRRQRKHNTLSIDSLAEDQHPAAEDPESAIRAAQLAHALKCALLELPLKCQQVFLWNKLEGYTQEEIAQKLGLSQSMVEKHMQRALRHLQEKLQSHASH